jgi:hypothetical protein
VSWGVLEATFLGLSQDKKSAPLGALKKIAIAAIREVPGLSIPMRDLTSKKAISFLTHFPPHAAQRLAPGLL